MCTRVSVCAYPGTSQKSECEEYLIHGTCIPGYVYVYPGTHTVRGKKKKWQKQKRKKDAKLKKSKRGGKNKEGLDRRGPRVQSKLMYEQTSFEHNHVCTVCSIPPCTR